MKKRVVIGFVGSTLDQGKHPDRWQRWRPSVNLVQHQDLQVDRFDLIHARIHQALAVRVAGDIGQISPETQVHRHTLDLADPWDFEFLVSLMKRNPC